MHFHRRIARRLHGDWTRRAVLAAGAALIALCQHLTPGVGPWQTVFPSLYFIPIVIAALYDGWRGGLLIALLSTAALVAAGPTKAVAPTDHMATLILYWLFGTIIGLYTDRERRQKRKYQELAEQLSSVYEKLQTNFEGMKRAERLSAIGQLSAGLAHEIRNPLASIAGAASILRRGQTFDAKAAKCLEIIESECKRLNGLLTTFLNFARPRPPKLQSVSIDSILETVIELAQHAIGSKSIEFRREVAPGVAAIECDPEQMTQVLLNLVINATEASEPGSVVTVAVDQTGGTTQIRVIDQGSGVAPEDIDKLFNPFFTTKETGTGLGLPVAHQIVGQMGGLLTAHRNPSGGMTFMIEFPMKEARKEA
ncbi:MAG: ATP-binding protein [Bryobacteraceae bacterium]|nr:ATP-binding protein [Bryobacteraceae bacterium]